MHHRGRLLRPSPRTPSRRRWGDQGAAAVELALVLPVLLLLVLGVIDFGRALQQQMLLTEAVREGARVGALNGTATDMQNQVKSLMGPGITPTFTTTTPCTSGSMLGSDSKLTVKFTFSSVTPVFALIQYFGGSSTGITISATGMMSCLG